MKYMTSIIVFCGPRWELQKIKVPPDTYDKVLKFDVPDDMGSFPDMEAYEYHFTDDQGNECIGHDAEKFHSEMEDDQLYPYMLKVVDAVTEFLTKNAERLEKLNFINIQTVMNGHKFGGKVMALAGFIKYQPMEITQPRSRIMLVGTQ